MPLPFSRHPGHLLLTAGAAMSIGVAQSHAQLPAVEYRVVVAYNAPSAHMPLPGNRSIHNLHRLSPGLAIVESDAHEIYLADGASLTPTMLPGTQIPGQAPGVVWASAPLGLAQTFELRDRGPLFHAYASGGDIGPNPLPFAFIGDLASGDALIRCPGSGGYGDVTPGGAFYLNQDSSLIQIGRVNGSTEVIVPAGASIPGIPEPIGSWGAVGLMNGAGDIANLASFTTGRPSVACVIENGVIRPVGQRFQSFDSDRGAVSSTSTPFPQTQPFADGSVVLSGSLMFPAGSTARSLWIIPPTGPASIIAAVGDHPPGTPDDITLGSAVALCATHGGLILWRGNLLRNGADAGNAVFLWSAGRNRLILRSQVASPGSPAGDPVPSLDFSSNPVIQLNEQGDVALMQQLGASFLYLYSKDAGTVEVARYNRPLPASTGIANPIATLSAYFGIASGSWISPGDDRGIPTMDHSGEIFVAGSTQNVGAAFGLFARISSPGCRPDYTQDGFLDFFDYIAFLDCFEGGACAMGKDADFNNDDFADFFDYADFIDAFESGC